MSHATNAPRPVMRGLVREGLRQQTCLGICDTCGGVACHAEYYSAECRHLVRPDTRSGPRSTSFALHHLGISSDKVPTAGYPSSRPPCFPYRRHACAFGRADKYEPSDYCSGLLLSIRCSAMDPCPRRPEYDMRSAWRKAGLDKQYIKVSNELPPAGASH